ncbi:uncharacterized protein LOC142336508 isoform X3 [Convolutriloba macropyga]|uniref:uncharacterized protein LOC142336508 isoform X3 n=1 Tax=Convolutriloba macropyga TaxID=536237 RepID=UPI003F526576
MGSETEHSQYDYLKYKPPEERMTGLQIQNHQTSQPHPLTSSRHQNLQLQHQRVNQEPFQRSPNGSLNGLNIRPDEPTASKSSMGNNSYHFYQDPNNIRPSQVASRENFGDNFSGHNSNSSNIRNLIINGQYAPNMDARNLNYNKPVTSQRSVMHSTLYQRPPNQTNYPNGHPNLRSLNGYDPYMQPDFGMNKQTNNHQPAMRPRVPQMNIVRPLGPITPQARPQPQDPSTLPNGPATYQNPKMNPNYGNQSVSNTLILYNRTNFSMGFANNKRLHPTIPEESPRKAELSPSETFKMTTNEPPSALNTSHGVNNTSEKSDQIQGTDQQTKEIEDQSLTEEEVRFYQEQSRRALNQNQHKYAAIVEQIDPKPISNPDHHYDYRTFSGPQSNLRQTQPVHQFGQSTQHHNRQRAEGQMTSFQMKNAARPMMMSRQFTFSDPEMTDLHIYIVPAQYWNEQYNCAYNTVMNYTISAGFIRVYPETPLVELRDVIIDQIGKQGGTLPKKFIFLKSVGRAMTQVKHMQEKQLKVKNFLPPFAYCPEIFIMSRDPIGESEDEAELDEDAIAMNKENQRLTEEKRKQIESMERDLEKKKTEAEREQHAKERELEQKQREMEKQSQEKQREIERTLAEQSKKLEEERFKLEREIQQQKDEQERQILEMQRNLEKKQQDEHYKRQKELDDKMRAQEQKFNEQNREMENQLLAREAEMRKKYQDQEKELMEKERAIEKEKMELEKKEMEHEKGLLQQETEKDKARLEQRKRMQQDTEKLAQMAKGIDVDLTGGGGQSSRPGTSPSKLRFPRPASPQLREDLNHKMLELKGLRDERRELEEFRGELIKKAKSLQIKAQGKRAAARDHWKKKYYEEKKKTAPLDEHLAKLRRELDTLNRRQIGRLEKELDGNQDHATIALVQNKILLSRLTHEISELRWRVEEAKLRLTGELKQRRQTTVEVEALQAELIQLNVTKITEAKTQQLIALRSSQTTTTNPTAHLNPILRSTRAPSPNRNFSSSAAVLEPNSTNHKQTLNVIASYESNIGNNRKVVTTVLKPISADSTTMTTDTSYSS